MVRMTTTDDGANARALHAFIAEECAAMGLTVTSWCRQVGLPDPTVLRWKGGTAPDMRSLRRVADGLGRSLMDVLIKANYLTPDEAGGHIPQPRSYDAREAIMLDPNLPDEVRDPLLNVFDTFMKVSSGNTQRAVVSSARPKTASRVPTKKVAPKTPTKKAPSKKAATRRG